MKICDAKFMFVDKFWKVNFYDASGSHGWSCKKTWVLEKFECYEGGDERIAYDFNKNLFSKVKDNKGQLMVIAFFEPDRDRSYSP